MGCFDVSCGISGITIKSGDKAKLLLIVPQRSYPHNTQFFDSEVKIESGLQQVHNEGPYGLYMPFCLPIEGEYNDYGSLENIKIDETVKGLERYFEISIDKLLEIFGNSCRSIYDHYSRILSEYGTGLEIDSYGDKSKVTPEWLIEAGFELKDDRYFHPDFPKLCKVIDGHYTKTEEPAMFVVFKRIKDSDETLPHISSWEYDKWKERHSRDRRGFCESIFEMTNKNSFDKKVLLGIKKEFRDRAILLKKISGMFIDEQFYDEFLKRSKDTVLESYMNKFLMEKLGFKFEKFIHNETKKEIKDDGMPTGSYRNKRDIVYTHSLAKGFLFCVGDDPNNMATDMYKIKGKEMVQIPTYSKGKSYHPFNPAGLAEMFKGETGNHLDLSPLNGFGTFDLKLLRIQDEIKRMENKELRMEQLKYEDFKTPEERMDFFDVMSGSNETDSTFGILDFPLVTQMYRNNFKNPADKFKNDCKNFICFVNQLWMINRLIMPSAHFIQHGEYEPQLEFNAAVLTVLKEKNRIYEERY